ncbi:hypothetical protein I6N96_12635 [Enterococcus sp. BWM-S5]|uniref:Uncharacterized protein n=1 Tax=Enterococcus larvae TaxID=2794352 RepID=A0ABS4CKW9_9ENTE|nr:hypothetical protein [Enterococcus larvae]MBP1047120.1 hypothetical protein [Enterococcus larvae]
MDSAVLWSDLEESKAFVSFSEKLEDKYGSDKIGYCGNWLIRDNYNKPFINDAFMRGYLGFVRSKEFEEEEIEKDRCLLNELLEELLAAGRKIIEILTENNQMSNIWDSSLSRDENNKRLTEAGFANYEKSFEVSIRVGKGTYFQVEYGSLKANQKPYFSTSACKFNKNLRDYDSGGQAQKDLLRAGSLAMDFYNKWDKFHTCCLTIEEYEQMKKELASLSFEWNSIPSSSFEDMADFERNHKYR